MKSMFFMLAILSLSSFAQVKKTFVTGKYEAINASDDVDVSELRKVGNKYVADIGFSETGGFSETIDLREENGKLVGGTSTECDDPGCCWFDSLDVEVTRAYSGQPMIKVSYEGYCYPEDSGDDEFEVSGLIKYLKI